MNRTLNAVASPPDARDFKFAARYAPQAETDLRQFNRDIEDQQSEGSCTSHAITNCLELMTQQAGEYENLSRQFQYFTTRFAEGRATQDGVFCLRDCLEVMRKTGVCLETEWPYLPSNVDVEPNVAAYTSASTRLVKRYEAIDIASSIGLGADPQRGIDAINAALAEGLPVPISLVVGDKIFAMHGSLESQRGQYWPVDAPWRHSVGNPRAGGHAVQIVGNSNRLGGWIIENSWGATWGDAGCGLLPYACIADLSEAWIIRAYKDIDRTDPALYAAQMQLVRLYVAVLDRAPELDGFNWWLNAMIAGTLTGAQIADYFFTSAERIDKFNTAGAMVDNFAQHFKAYDNRCTVAAYSVIDLAINKPDVAAQALDGVTDDPATVDIAKKRLRSLMAGASGVL